MLPLCYLFILAFAFLELPWSGNILVVSRYLCFLKKNGQKLEGNIQAVSRSETSISQKKWKQSLWTLPALEKTFERPQTLFFYIFSTVCFLVSEKIFKSLLQALLENAQQLFSN